MKKLKGGKDMGLVQAQMAFYHDSVGTKAQNEIFEVQNENLCAELESAGYVKKLEADQAQTHHRFCTTPTRIRSSRPTGKRSRFNGKSYS